MPKLVHRTQSRLFVVGAIAVSVMTAVAYVGITVQSGGELPLRSYTFVKAAFDDVGTLKKGQDVTQNGVRVGTVREIEYVDGSAVVTMRLDGDRDIYQDAQASLRSESALGRKQIGILPGTAQAGPLGDAVIPETQTTSSTALDDVFTAFDKRTRAALQTSLRELGGGVGGHGKDLRALVQNSPALLDDLGIISGSLTSQEADLPAMLEAADRLAGRFRGRDEELAALLRDVDATLDAVAVDDGKPLRETVASLPATLNQARTGLTSLNKPLADLRRAMATVRPGARALASSSGDLRGFLRESLRPLGKVPAVAERAEPAVEDLTRTFADARPLVSKAALAFADANVLLRGLAPYATDMGRFFSEHDLLSGRIAPDKHFFSASLVLPGLRSLSLPDPLADTVPYPAPNGGAWDDNPASGGAR